MKKIILLTLILVFGLVATGAVSIPNTYIDDAIAGATKRAFSPIGAWLMQSQGVKNVVNGVGNVAKTVVSLPGKVISGIRTVPGVVKRVGTNAKNSLVPFWANITRGKKADLLAQGAGSSGSNRSPLPLIATMCTLFALITVKNKRLPLLLLLLVGTVSFIYYL